MSGAERGVAPALAAAGAAEAAYAHDDAATFLRIALDLMPAEDVRRPRLLARLGLALTWALRFEEAVEAAREAGDAIARAEGDDAAADYLAEAAQGMSGWVGAGYWRGAWALATQGLRYAAERRDATWASLKSLDLLRAEAEDPDFPGHMLDTPERRAVARVSRASRLKERTTTYFHGCTSPREPRCWRGRVTRTGFLRGGGFPCEPPAVHEARCGDRAPGPARGGDHPLGEHRQVPQRAG